MAPEALGCVELMADRGAPASPADIEASLRAVQANLFPELDGVDIALGSMTSDTDYFVSNLELDTFEYAPLERSYLVLHNEAIFEVPPPHDAVVAILAHELKHVVDYTELDSAGLAEFALWYATEDTAAYERETDEHALELGCGTGLIAYREWLYERIGPEATEAKRRTYYTPEEIEAWMQANP